MPHAAMNRRTFAYGLASVVLGLPGICSARNLVDRPPWGRWKTRPSILIISDRDDPRLPAVHEAINFWNAVFQDLGSPFRLDPVAHIAEVVPTGDDRRNSHRGLDQLLRLFQSNTELLLTHVRNLSGDLIVALSNGIEAFAIGSQSPRKVLVVIRTHRAYPDKMQHAVLRTIAHELGHAIGLGHSVDSAALMCSGLHCAFPSPRLGPLSLSLDEVKLLMEMYPPSWREEGWRG